MTTQHYRQRRLWTGLASLLLAAASTGCSVFQSTPPSGAYVSPEGVEVVPLTVEDNEIAEILDIQRWKFAVSAPQEFESVTADYQVELRQPNQPPQQLVASTISYPAEASGAFEEDITVAVYPIGGDSLLNADRVKWYIGTEQPNGQSSFSTVGENPFKGLNLSSPIQPAQLQEDGQFQLFLASRGNVSPPSESDRVSVNFTVRVSPDAEANSEESAP